MLSTTNFFRDIGPLSRRSEANLQNKGSEALMQKITEEIKQKMEHEM
jgi:hypothetical protein